MSTKGSPNAIAVSVIVPVYNSAKSISKCITSLLASQYDPSGFEIICVDNNSTDDSLGILRSFEPTIRVLTEAKRGPSAARNAGLRAASGLLIAFTDADCSVDPGWLAAMVRSLEQTSADAVGGRILARPEAAIIERFGELVHDHRNAIEVCWPPYMITMNLAMRRDLLVAMGGFDERWLRVEDVDLSYRLLAAGKHLGYCDEAVIYHHNRDRVWTLMREAYRHGSYGVAYLQVNSSLIDSLRAASPTPSEVRSSPVSPLGAGVSPLQRAFLWRIFRTAKRVGVLVGRRFPPALG